MSHFFHLDFQGFSNYRKLNIDFIELVFQKVPDLTHVIIIHTQRVFMWNQSLRLFEICKCASAWHWKFEKKCQFN